MKPLALSLLSLSVISLSANAWTIRDDDWPESSPEAHGLSTELLEQAGDDVRNVPLRYCLTVIKDGELVYDRNYLGYQNGSFYAYSVTKTLGAVLVGITEHQGYLQLDDKISDWLGEVPSSMNPDATIRHVLGQVSHSDPLGSDFSYNTGARINTLSAVLKEATGMNTLEYAQDQMLIPLNMNYTSWATDSDDNVTIGAGTSSSCRDLARVGQLMMNGGRWNGQQLLSQSYIEDMVQPSYPDANSNYGYLTWLNKSEGPWHRPLTSGTGIMVEGAPRNAWFATGFFGQLIIGIPDENIVITTMGTSLQLETLNTLQNVWDAVAPAVMPE